MRNFRRCHKCNCCHWDNEDCAPLFLVYFYEYSGEEPTEIYAYTYEDAAVKFTKDYNEATDCSLMNDEIVIKIEKDGVVKHIKVGVVSDVYYSTKEIEPTNE